MYDDSLSYEDVLQLDGAFSVVHINYGKSPVFNGIDSKYMSKSSIKNHLLSLDHIENIDEYLYSFDGTEKDFNSNDRITLWKNYWMEYMNAFDKLIISLPSSVVTIYVGRQAIEIGLKYLLLKKNGQIKKTHDLEKLSNLLFSEYAIEDNYMNDVNKFCRLFCQYIEGGNVEYFRFPEYKKNTYFAGNRLDISWLSWNFALVLTKLIHFAGLDDKM